MVILLLNISLTQHIDQLEIKIATLENKLTNISKIDSITSININQSNDNILSDNIINNYDEQGYDIPSVTISNESEYINNEYPIISSTTTVPSEIGNLTNLTLLSLNSNKLTTPWRADPLNPFGRIVPSEICNLTNLTQLDLRCNKLTNLQSEICNLTNLTQLSLNDNQLKNLPSEICNLTNLTYLSLCNNKLTNELKIQINSWFKNCVVYV